MRFEAQNIRYSYGSKPLLQEISFRVPERSVYCLTGPNGSGKTTLIGLALRDLKPVSGQFLLDGKDTTEFTLKEHASRIAYVPQVHRRTFAYTVREVVRMGRNRLLSGLYTLGKEDDAVVDRVLTQMGLSDLAEVPYTTLSGGELQVVLIARALVQESQMLIMDEPTANLDIDRSLSALSNLAKLVKEQEKTVFVVSHDLTLPLYLEDIGCPVTLAVLSEGRIAIEDTPHRALENPLLQKVYGVKSKLVNTEWDGVNRHGVIHSLLG